jgi:Lrp/AsnC family transcriptional regulator, leucine-responsive regulatory protein
MTHLVDEVDLRILRILQKDSSIRNTDLAEQVGLSASPCLRRVKILEETGIIARYVALVNGANVGFPMVVFCRVTLDRQDKATVENFAKAMLKMPQVTECYLIAGQYDYLLKVVTSDLDSYQEFQMNSLTPMPDVRNVFTEIPLKKVKATTEIPF